jgi:hypothetical protein
LSHYRSADSGDSSAQSEAPATVAPEAPVDDKAKKPDDAKTKKKKKKKKGKTATAGG